MKFEFKYYAILLGAALFFAVANNLRLEEPLDWFGSPKVLEKPPELQEAK